MPCYFTCTPRVCVCTSTINECTYATITYVAITTVPVCKRIVTRACDSCQEPSCGTRRIIDHGSWRRSRCALGGGGGARAVVSLSLSRVLRDASSACCWKSAPVVLYVRWLGQATRIGQQTSATQRAATSGIAMSLLMHGKAHLTTFDLQCSSFPTATLLCHTCTKQATSTTLA